MLRNDRNIDTMFSKMFVQFSNTASITIYVLTVSCKARFYLAQGYIYTKTVELAVPCLVPTVQNSVNISFFFVAHIFNYLHSDSFNFIHVFVEDVFSNKVRSPEFLSTEWTKPLIFCQFLSVCFHKLICFSK